jgi:hypothetical protein
MTFSYSGNPSDSDKDAIRFLIQDTDEDEPFLQDEEIIFIASHWVLSESIYYAAAQAAETIAARFAREVTVNSDSQTVSTSELQQKFQLLAERLRQMHNMYMAGGYVDAGGMLKELWRDPTVAPLAFGTGMHDDPEAGQQDLGSREYYYYDPLKGY